MLTLTRINKIRLLVAGKHPWIDKMLDHRESLIKKYMTLIDLRVRGVEDCPPSYTKVEDYLSSGHFDIYPRIVTVMENATGRRLAIAQRIIPRIRHNTDLILSFDDKYGEELNEAKMKDLREDPILSLIIFKLIQIIRETRAGQLAKGIIFLLLAYFTCVIFKFKAMEFLLSVILNNGFIAILIMFQPEMRRAEMSPGGAGKEQES